LWNKKQYNIRKNRSHGDLNYSEIILSKTLGLSQVHNTISKTLIDEFPLNVLIKWKPIFD